MSGQTQDGTVEPISRKQFLRREREQGKNIFSVQLTTSRVGNHTRLVHALLKVVLTILHSAVARVAFTLNHGEHSERNLLV